MTRFSVQLWRNCIAGLSVAAPVRDNDHSPDVLVGGPVEPLNVGTQVILDITGALVSRLQPWTWQTKIKTTILVKI